MSLRECLQLTTGRGRERCVQGHRPASAEEEVDGGTGQRLLRLRMFLPFSWPRGHILRGMQMELEEENGNGT